MSLPEFVLRKRGSATIWVARRFLEETFVDLLEDADGLFKLPECEIIKDQRKIKIGRVKLQIAGQDHWLYIKRYNAFSLRYKLFSLFSRSGARRSLDGVAILNQAAIQTVTPVAAVENRIKGVLAKSFFLSEEVSLGKTVHAYWTETLRIGRGPQGMRRRRVFLARLARLFRSLHQRHIYHNDLKDWNILVAPVATGEEIFYLVDLEGVRRFTRLNKRRRRKNLFQLYRSLGEFLSRTEKLWFLKSYGNNGFSRRGLKSRWIKQIFFNAPRVDE